MRTVHGPTEVDRPLDVLVVPPDNKAMAETIESMRAMNARQDHMEEAHAREVSHIRHQWDGVEDKLRELNAKTATATDIQNVKVPPLPPNAVRQLTARLVSIQIKSDMNRP